MAGKIGRILVTNDDGIDAPGLRSSVKIAKQLSDDVWVVAPREEQSGASHSLSLNAPLRLIKRGVKRYAVTGTPTDCVMVATRSMLRDTPPDLILSGVNFGQNIAEDVSYSGTVSAAKEGTVFGIPSIAMSQALTFNPESFSRNVRFGVAEKNGAAIIRKLLSVGWPPDTLMNINFPDIDPNSKCQVRITKQGKRDQRLLCIEERMDPRNNPYFWYDFNRAISKPGKGTDIEAIMQGHVSITPLHMDHTANAMKRKLHTLFD